MHGLMLLQGNVYGVLDCVLSGVFLGHVFRPRDCERIARRD